MPITFSNPRVALPHSSLGNVRIAAAVGLVLIVASIDGGCNSRAVQLSSKLADFHKAIFTPVAGTSPLKFEARVGNRQFLLAEPDDPRNPTAWQGPLWIEDLQKGASCEANVSLVRAVYAAPGTDVAIAVAYSGSLTYVHFFDVKSCQEKQSAIEAFTEGVQVVGRQVRILPGCECHGPSKPCDCSAGQVVAIDAESRAVLQEKDSLDLTKEIIGVAFTGRKKVARPRTPNAKLVGN